MYTIGNRSNNNSNCNKMVHNTFNIIDLIENNPITRLTGDCPGRMLEKVRNNFTETEQQLFLSSFYCYLNYDQKLDFVVDLDNVWEWLGFTQKITAKRLLEKHFTLNIDYKIMLYTLPEDYLLAQSGVKNKRGAGGSNKQNILMTVRTFKLYCLKSGTKKANEIHEYYMKLEEMLQEVIEEESIELRLQLSKKNEELVRTRVELNTINTNAANDQSILRESIILDYFSNNHQCVYYGTIDNISISGEKLVKFGNSNDLVERVKEHRKTYDNFRLINAFSVKNKTEIENGIKTHVILSKFRRSKVINDKSRLELLALTEDMSLDNIEKIIREIIKKHDCTVENYIAIFEENIRLTELNMEYIKNEKIYKEQNDQLLLENNRFAERYGESESTIYKTCPIKCSGIVPCNSSSIASNNIIPLNAVSLKKFRRHDDNLFHINGIKYVKLIGTRLDVWYGRAYKSSGDLLKDDLIINDVGTISKKKRILSSVFHV